jgi:hypothetical protein
VFINFSSIKANMLGPTKEFELGGVRLTTKIVLERLKELLDELESEDLEHLDNKLESCWVECREKECDPSISQNIIDDNRKILQEICIAIEVYQAGAINSEKLKAIKTNLLKNKPDKYVSNI